MMKDVRSNVVWYNGSERKSFVRFLQVFTDKTVTSLKVGSVTAYVVHVTLLNAIKKFRRKLIQSGKTIVGFLPTGVTETSIDNSSNGTYRKVTELVFIEIDRQNSYQSKSWKCHRLCGACNTFKRHKEIPP